MTNARIDLLLDQWAWSQGFDSIEAFLRWCPPDLKDEMLEQLDAMARFGK